LISLDEAPYEAYEAYGVVVGGGAAFHGQGEGGRGVHVEVLISLDEASRGSVGSDCAHAVDSLAPLGGNGSNVLATMTMKWHGVRWALRRMFPAVQCIPPSFPLIFFP
jgi:hypothetical protein